MQQSNMCGPGALPRPFSLALAHEGPAPPEDRHKTGHHALVLIDGAARALTDKATVERLVLRLLSPAAHIEGVDRLLGDTALRDGARKARAFVLLLPPLGNLDNPLYRVHPRRNDRFLAARPPLKALFPEIDFADFDFTGHLLGSLAATCPVRFAEVQRILSAVWCERVAALLAVLPPRGILLHSTSSGRLPLPVAVPAGPGRQAMVVNPADPRSTVTTLRRALVALLPFDA